MPWQSPVELLQKGQNFMFGSIQLISYVHSLMSNKDLGATINPYSKPKISEDQTL